MLKIYGTPKSRAFRCYWTLEEIKERIDLPYETISVQLGLENPAFDKNYLSIHPLGKIPALVDTEKNFTLFESHAICVYLANLDPEKKLIGGTKPNIQDFAKITQWISFTTTELEQPLWLQMKRGESPKNRADFERCMNVLSNHLKDKEYLVNNEFSLADIFVVHTMFWAKMSDFNYLDDVTKAYYTRIRNRNSVLKLMGKQ